MSSIGTAGRTWKVQPGAIAVLGLRLVLTSQFVAALGLVGLMGGAVVTNVFVIGESPAVPLVMLVVAGVVAWFRRSSVRALIQRGGQ
jgi:putative oxidoreductase